MKNTKEICAECGKDVLQWQMPYPEPESKTLKTVYMCRNRECSKNGVPFSYEGEKKTYTPVSPSM